MSNLVLFVSFPSSLNATGLVSYWPVRSDLKDYIGSADLVPSSQTIFTSNLLNTSNQALVIDDGQYFGIPSGKYFNGGPFTVSAWLYPIRTPIYSRVIDFLSAAGRELYIAWNGSDGVAFGSYVTARYSVQCEVYNANNSLPQTHWSHLAYVFDNSTYYLYFNGTLIASVPVCDKQQWVNENHYYNFIGHSVSGDQDPHGYVDEIKIYARALNQDEITKDMNFFL